MTRSHHAGLWADRDDINEFESALGCDPIPGLALNLGVDEEALIVDELDPAAIARLDEVFRKALARQAPALKRRAAIPKRGARTPRTKAAPARLRREPTRLGCIESIRLHDGEWRVRDVDSGGELSIAKASIPATFWDEAEEGDLVEFRLVIEDGLELAKAPRHYGHAR